MAYLKETYIAEWAKAYAEILEQATISMITGKDTPLEKLFRLIDESSGDTTAIERLSMKKDAYMQIMQEVVASGQQTALALVDKQFTFDLVIDKAKADTELAKSKLEEQQNKTQITIDSVPLKKRSLTAEVELAEGIKEGKIELTTNQANKVLSDKSYVEAQQTALETQVDDNRKIKALQALGDTYGTGMAGGIKITSDMWGPFFDICGDLSGAKLTGTDEDTDPNLNLTLATADV